MDRRVFLAGMAASAVLAACGLPPLPPDLDPNAVVPKETMLDWIQQIIAQGVRRPGYPADEWTEQFVYQKFCDFGLENVRMEPVEVQRWTPDSWSLEATPAGGPTRVLDCFPCPYTASVEDLELELAPYNTASPGDVAGKASLLDVPLLNVPAWVFAALGSPAPPNWQSRIYDPDGTIVGGEPHLLPFGEGLNEVMDPSIANGAAAFIGVLENYPGDHIEYFVPYDAVNRPIPGLWVRGSDGQWLHDQLALGPVTVKINTDTTVELVESHNVVGELPGADDEMVMIGSHHDAPWASAVEDGSGIAMVLAQAKFWSATPAARRPHKLLFVLQGGHMSGGAGLHKFIADHNAELDQIVLEVHLEHAARQFVQQGSDWVYSGKCVPRWWFTSRNPQLENAVLSALQTERLTRSMLVAPNAIGEQPATDGAFYYTEGVPVAQFLGAPWYLFDSRDTFEKVDQDNLVALQRATIRMVDFTAGISAAEMRAGVI